MKARWSIPQRPVRTAAVAEVTAEDENTPTGKTPEGTISKPAKAKTTRAKKQEK